MKRGLIGAIALACAIACRDPKPVRPGLSNRADISPTSQDAGSAAAITCEPDKAKVLQRALERKAGRALPVRFTVFPDSAIHLEFTATSLDVATARLLAAWRGPSWAGALHLKLDNLTSLDVATAEALAGWTATGTYFSLHLSLNGLRSIDADAALALSAWNGAHPTATDHIEWDYYEPDSSVHLSLNGLTTLDAKVARALIVRWQISPLRSAMHLELNGVQTVQDDGLRFLKAPEGDLSLSLNGLTSLTPNIAKMIGTWPHRQIELQGIKALNAPVATELSRWSGESVDVSGVEALDAGTARALAGFSGHALNFNGLRAIDASTASALVSWRGRELRLNGITRLDVKTAKTLVSWNARDRAAEQRIERELRANAKPDEPATEAVEPPLETKIANAIRNLYDRQIHLTGLDKPGAGVQAALAKWHGHHKLVVAGSPPPDEPDFDDPDRAAGCALTRLDPTLVRTLIAEARRGRSFDRADEVVSALGEWTDKEPDAFVPASLSPVDAAVLRVEVARDDTTPDLDKLTLIDAAVINALNHAAFGQMVFDVTALDRAQAAVLARWSGESLWLNRLTELTPAAADRLATWQGSTLYLNGVTRLDTATAAALAQWGGDKLELDGVQTLRPKAAEALATWGGTRLELDGVQTLDPATARELAAWNGRKLELDGLVTLGAATAAALGRWGGKEIELDGLRYLDLATVNALIAGNASVTWDGRPISLSMTTPGVEVPDPIDRAMTAVLGIPSNSMSMVHTDGLRGVGTRLGAGEARAIAALRGVRVLDLNSLTALSARAATALARWRGDELLLSGVTRIDPAAAKALAGWVGDTLNLDGVTSLDAKTAAALARFRGDRLELRGVRYMDLATATALLTRTGGDTRVNSYLVVDEPTAQAVKRASNVEIQDFEPWDDLDYPYLEVRLSGK